jgi:hypothetical protein
MRHNSDAHSTPTMSDNREIFANQELQQMAFCEHLQAVKKLRISTPPRRGAHWKPSQVAYS